MAFEFESEPTIQNGNFYFSSKHCHYHQYSLTQVGAGRRQVSHRNVDGLECVTPEG